MLHRQFSELVDCVSDQITSYHNNVICTVILQDAHGHNWTDSRAFYEVIPRSCCYLICLVQVLMHVTLSLKTFLSRIDLGYLLKRL